MRENLRKFIGTGFAAHHEIKDYYEIPSLKVFRGVVTMTPDDRTKPAVKPSMAHFFYMNQRDPSKVSRWIGAVGLAEF